VVQIHCKPWTFFQGGQVLFANPLFKHLTSLSLNLFHVLVADVERWDWSQFKSLSFLRDFWLTIDILNPTTENSYLTLFEDRIIPLFPTNLEVFAVFMDFEHWGEFVPLGHDTNKVG
jgi:hypothetical protein